MQYCTLLMSKHCMPDLKLNNYFSIQIDGNATAKIEEKIWYACLVLKGPKFMANIPVFNILSASHCLHTHSQENFS